MKIPVYQPGRVGGGNTLPGVSFSARKNPGAMAQAEMDKAAPLLTAMNVATQFAQKRYELTRDNLLSEALLQSQKELRMTSRELANSDNPNLVMDGENPIWNEQSQRIKEKAQNKLLKDKYSQNVFNQRFAQAEMQNSFWLRDQIDVKKEAFALDQLTKAANQIKEQYSVPGSKITDFEDSMDQFRVSLDRNIQQRLLDEDVKESSIRGLKNEIAKEFLNNYYKKYKHQGIENIKQALEESNASLAPDASVLLNLLNEMTVEEQKAIIAPVDASSNYINSTDEKRKQQAAVAKSALESIKDNTNKKIKLLNELGRVSLDELNILRQQNEELKNVDDAKYQDNLTLINQALTLVQISDGLRNSDRDSVSAFVADLEAKKTEDNLFVLDFAKKFQKEMETQLQDDAISFVKNVTDDIVIEDVPLLLNTDNAVRKAKRRIQSAELVRWKYKLPNLQILTKAEVASLQGFLNQPETTTQDRFDILKRYQQVYGSEDLFEIARQLNDGKADHVLIGAVSLFAMGGEENAQAAFKVLQGRDDLKSEIRKPLLLEKFRQYSLKEILPAFDRDGGQTAESYDVSYKTAEAIYASLYRENPTEIEESAMFEDAWQMAMSNRLGDVNEYKTILPIGMDASTFEKIVNQLTPDLIFAASAKASGWKTHKVDKDMAKSIQDGKFVAHGNPENGYLVKLKIEGEFQIALDEDGEPIFIDPSRLWIPSNTLLTPPEILQLLNK